MTDPISNERLEWQTRMHGFRLITPALRTENHHEHS
jgi:hypothetical protein